MANKGMRWSTAVDVVTTGVEAHIAQKNAEANDARSLLYLLRRIGPPEKMGGGDVEPLPSRAISKRPAPGSIPDRVLAIVAESGGTPMTMTDILAAKHGAKDSWVKTAVRQLVKAGRLVATGATHSRRYQLPAKRKGAA